MTLPFTHRRLMSLFVLAWLPGLPPALAQAPSADGAPRVREEWHKAYTEKNWPLAIELGLKAVELSPKDGVMQYNLACVYSLSGEADKAAEWLGKAAGNGFNMLGLFETDPDLNNVREHAGYQAALGVVKDNFRQAQAGIREKFEKQPPIVITPPGRDLSKPAPLIIALHGYGDWSKAIAQSWRGAAGHVGAILVAPQAVRPVVGAGFNWGDIEEADYIVQLTLESVIKAYNIDEKRIILTGFSQGGFIAFSIGVRHPERFCGVIPMGGPYIPAIDAPKKVSGERLPRYYFMIGENDRAVAENRQAAKDFAAAGYDVKLVVYPGVGHAFPRNRDEELRRAVKYVLGEESWGLWDKAVEDRP